MTDSSHLPALTAAQMAEVDRIMAEELGLDVLQVMEVAGRAVAVFARARYFDGDPRSRRVVVLCGSGGNGGDGMVAARYLQGWGAEVEVWLGRRPERGAAAHQLAILERIGVPVVDPTSTPILPPADLVIDALLGFSLVGPPRGETAALIAAANAQQAPVLTVDLPSGLDATTGAVYEPCIRADATLTLALPKTGLLVPGTRPVVGDLTVADIGVPPVAYTRLGLTLPSIFAREETITIPLADR